MFLWNKKEVVLDCYTDRGDVYNLFPIVEAKKKIPDWVKAVPKPYFSGIKDSYSSIKNCPGLMDYCTKGFILPLWSDLSIILGKKGELGYEWQYSDKCSEIEIHHPAQTNNHFPETEYQHLKLVSPWAFVCNENIPFLAVEPGWQFDVLKNFRVLTGVLDFKAQIGTNINMFGLKGDEARETILFAGTPIYHFIPMTNKKIKLRLHLVSKERLHTIRESCRSVSFFNSYGKKKKILEKSGCPYKFDTED